MAHDKRRDHLGTMTVSSDGRRASRARHAAKGSGYPGLSHAPDITVTGRAGWVHAGQQR